MRALAGVARGLRLGDYVRLGRGEDGTGGRDKSSILADTLEAVIGAVYIERGLEEASSLVHRLFDPVIARSARLGAGLDWKTSLQELTASEVLGVPEYHVDESGPDHQKSFRATVRVGGHVYGSGEGRSKKEAEQQAAETAWNAISNGEGPVNADGTAEPANGTPAAGTGNATSTGRGPNHGRPADNRASSGSDGTDGAGDMGNAGHQDGGSPGRRGARETPGNSHAGATRPAE